MTNISPITVMKRLILLSLVFMVSVTLAETFPSPDTTDQHTKIIKYVGDHLVITLRSGKTNAHKIVRNLASGTSIEVLEEQDEYSWVKTQNGDVGWVRSQYLVTEPIAKQQLVEAKKQLAKYALTQSQHEKEIQKLKTSQSKLEKLTTSLKSDNDKLNEELNEMRSFAAQPLEFAKQNKVLSKKSERLEEQNSALISEVENLRSTSDKKWFAVGGFTVFISIIAGVILPKLSRGRRSKWEKL